MHFTCPEEHFDENIVGFLKYFPPLGEKISDFGAENLQPCYQICNLAPEGQMEE